MCQELFFRFPPVGKGNGEADQGRDYEPRDSGQESGEMNQPTDQIISCAVHGSILPLVGCSVGGLFHGFVNLLRFIIGQWW